MTAGLAVREVSCRIGGHTVLRSVSFELRAGELVALLGANGAGKTTLLRILLGLQRPASGSVLLEGDPLSSHGRRGIARRLAYVPQAHVPVFPYLVSQVVALGRLPVATLGRGISPEDRRVAQAALERLSIVHLSDRPYTQISGGERQSVLIARALAQGARTLILDEPATGLDFGQQLRLAAILRGLSQDGFMVLSTSHDPLRARTAFDRVILLHRGHVLADGPAAETISEQAIRTLYNLGSDEPVPALS